MYKKFLNCVLRTVLDLEKFRAKIANTLNNKAHSFVHIHNESPQKKTLLFFLSQSDLGSEISDPLDPRQVDHGLEKHGARQNNQNRALREINEEASYGRPLFNRKESHFHHLADGMLRLATPY
ncbi:hypothetical protein CEXT_109561 [Caerostris extrusa]|uniref:Uncharacterized protein n=1 Tax=Caerostris extrusa TaxID=172846 RepID=A0AAV4MAJ2_CAEEX|nr:hypothetical protein CEXT_109561 [Caerostris extrusa]